MKSGDYIKEVLSHISSDKYSQRVKSELQAHIEDEIEHYVSIGYSREDASDIVAEKMGDSALAGKQFDMLSSEKASKIFSIIILLLYAAEILFFMISVLGWESGYSTFGIISETSILLLSLITLLISNKYKNSVLPFIAFTFIVVFYFLFILYNSSVLLYSAFLLCTGKFNDINILLGLDNHITGKAFYIITNVLYLALLCAHVYIIKNNNDFINQKYPLKKVYREIRVKKLLFIALALIILISAGTFAVIYSYDNEYDDYYTGVQIVESDTQCSFEDVDGLKENYIYITYDWGNNLAFTEGPAFIEDSAEMLYDTEKYNSTISYETETLYGEYKASKKYIAVIPTGRDYDTYKLEWYSVSDIDELSGKLNDDLYYKIKIV